MLETVFIKLLNMSLVAGWLILTVIALRFFFKKVPKWIMCVLWALVAVRLVFPFSIESMLSLIPSAEIIEEKIMYAAEPSIATGIPYLNNAVNPMIQESFSPVPWTSVNPLQIWMMIAANVWILGMIVLILYAFISYFRLRKKVSTAIRMEKNIWESEYVDSPFILGIIRPQIYLPIQMEEEQRKYVVAHEQAHLTRKDHWWKPLGYLILTIYWFQPLCWIAYWLFCKDVEIACDEKVIKDFDLHDKKLYSLALVSCSAVHRSIAACPLAFGETDVKNRIKNVLHYRKAAFWMIVIAFMICVVIAVCFLTDPKTKENQIEDVVEEIPIEKVADDYTLEDALAEDMVVMADGEAINGQEKWKQFYEATLNGKPANIKVVYYYTLGDASRYDPDYYESIKDEYPKLFVSYLYYDGSRYTLTSFSEEQQYMGTFSYLMRYEKEEDPKAFYSDRVKYVLVNDSTVTWSEIQWGMLSSQSGDYIEHEMVYAESEE